MGGVQRSYSLPQHYTLQIVKPVMGVFTDYAIEHPIADDQLPLLR